MLAALAFLDARYVRNYRKTMGRFRVHLQAVSEGPAETFFGSALGTGRGDATVEIRGHCIQCGNCCMNHRCAFLEARGGGIFQCGIYTSFWRRFSNCGAYPVDARDIERYACPGYIVAGAALVRAEPVQIGRAHV